MCAGVSLVQRVAVQETQEQKWKRKYGKVPALKFARFIEGRLRCSFDHAEHAQKLF